MDKLGFIAFLLSIPMAVVANILTPKVQRWWATTSVRRRARRLAYLKTTRGVCEVVAENSSAKINQISNGLYDLTIAFLWTIAFGLFIYAVQAGYLLGMVMPYSVYGIRLPHVNIPFGLGHVLEAIANMVLLLGIGNTLRRALYHFELASDYHRERLQKTLDEEYEALVDKSKAESENPTKSQS